MTWRYDILHLLADGRFHSGTALGHALGVGRGGVWKALRHLPPGLTVHGVRGKGYRLATPLELLDAAQLQAAVPAAKHIIVLPEVDSTNRYLLGPAGAVLPSGSLVCAEMQTAGRGRHGRPWLSPFGCNIYLSVLWHCVGLPAPSLSVALGAAVAQALHSLGATEVQLKWPNDLLWRGRKLGGLLVEISGEAAGISRLVAGVGINIRLPLDTLSAIDQPATDLASALGTPPSRHQVASQIATAMLETLAHFNTTGLSPYLATWDHLDAVRDRAVTLTTARGTHSGIARGIALDGALRVETAQGIEHYHSGDVSLRLVAAHGAT